MMTIAAAAIAEQYPAKITKRCKTDIRELLLLQFANVEGCTPILPKPINDLAKIV